MPGFDPEEFKKFKEKNAAAFNPDEFSQFKDQQQSGDATTMPGMAWQATKEALNTPFPVVGKPLAAAKTGLTNAANEAEQFYNDSGHSTIGAVAGKGGRFLADAIPSTVGDALAQASAGPLIEGGGAILNKAKPVVSKVSGAAGKIATATGDILSELVAHISGSTPEAVKDVFQNPGIMKKARSLIGEAEQGRLVKAIGDHISTLGGKIRDFETEFAKFTERNPRKLPVKVNTGDLAKDISENLISEGYSIPKDISGVEKRLIDRINNPAERDEIHGFLQSMSKAKNMSWGDALNLKRQLDDAINYSTGAGLPSRGDSAQHALKMMRSSVKDALTEALPKENQAGWVKANDAYHEAMQGYDELKRNLVGSTPEKTASKLLGRLKKGYQDIGINDQAAKIGKKALRTIEDLQHQVSAGTFKKYISGWGEGGFAKVLPTSPMLMGGLTAGAGLSAQMVKALAEGAINRPNLGRLALQEAPVSQMLNPAQGAPTPQ